MTQGFSNPIAGGGGALIRPTLHSPDYVTGVSGWTINKDGTAEFNGILIRGTIILGNGTTNTIIFDDTRDAMFVYNSTGKLIASIAPTGGVDSLGNVYLSDICSYDPVSSLLFAQLKAGILQLSTGDAAQVEPAQLFTGVSDGPAHNQPTVSVASPTNDGANIATALFELFGSNTTGAAAPFFRSRNSHGVELDWLHQGEVKYSAPGFANWGETWHAIPFAANWGNLGAPWSSGAYRKSNGGTVELTGAIQWLAGATAAPVLITQLPTGYRPVAQKHLLTATMPAPGATPQMETIEVRTDGTVWITNYPAGGPNTPITLEGLWFPLGN